MRFTGKRAIVTGSAGAIGGAIATAFASEGARVGLIDLKPSLQTAESIRALGQIGFDYPADLTRSVGLQQSFRNAIGSLGGIDILVNAGGVTSFGSAATLEEAEWDRVLAVNLKGVFLCCQAVIGTMRQQGRGGRIVNIGSLLGKNGGNARPWLDASEQDGSGNVAYGVSKAGVHALTVYLARELAPARVTVNAVAPGPVVSGMTQNFPERLRSLIPLGRMGLPAEVAAAVLFLASEEAAFITGEVLDINGGAWGD
jgi:NAD(P)-dependent dehydrogenase (short-subunit alcohol dehydrogenase family)